MSRATVLGRSVQGMEGSMQCWEPDRHAQSRKDNLLEFLEWGAALSEIEWAVREIHPSPC